ncbi:hypothetical protein BSLG_008041 [Batrachochytrium salamandrivorans]|nr:hypothetical protein BSLG_008041 [Batrachochytrium salamandrivorans]
MASSTGLSTAGWIAVAVNPLVLSLAGLGLLSACWLLSGRFQAAALHRSVKGKHVLVTGASRGLGKALALDLALAGAQVTLVARGCDIEDMATGRSSLAVAVDEIRAACGDALDSDAVSSTIGHDHSPHEGKRNRKTNKSAANTTTNTATNTTINTTTSTTTNTVSRIRSYAVDLTDYAATVAFVSTLQSDVGMPDWIIANAGASIPGFIADQLPIPAGTNSSTTSSTTNSSTTNNTTTNSKDAHTGLVHERMISINYYSAVHIVRAVLQAAKDVATRDTGSVPDKTHQCDDITGNHHKDDSRLVAGVSPLMLPHLPERIVLVGSILSMIKYAIRGLADSLRSELLPAGIKVHAYFPGNMNTPGFDLESKTKPIITAEIEGTASAVTPRDASQFLLASILSDRFCISNDYLGELIRVASNGTAPRPNVLFEIAALPLIALIFAGWSAFADYSIRKHFSR